ncbi:MAG: hypothetical protein RKH07_00425 [Gammaproteobacteria bacterium]
MITAIHAVFIAVICIVLMHVGTGLKFVGYFMHLFVRLLMHFVVHLVMHFSMRLLMSMHLFMDFVMTGAMARMIVISMARRRRCASVKRFSTSGSRHGGLSPHIQWRQQEKHEYCD